jgi:WD40 repeat protein
MSRLGSRSLALLLLLTPAAPAQDPDVPLLPADRTPHLVVAHPGPHAPVTALVFAPNGETLYVAGFDKHIRRYALVKGKWTAAGAYRVPIGPGNAGVVNALALSPDGRWLAAAGRAPMRGETSGGGADRVSTDLSQIPALLRRDCGVVYLFDTTKADNGRVVRGQESEVRALAFANPAPAGANLLVTAGIEWDAKGTATGTLRAFRVTDADARPLGAHAGLPATVIPPGLAAWATGAKGLRVAVAWDAADNKPGSLLLWDDPAPGEPKSARVADAVLNGPLTVRVEKGSVTRLVTGGYSLDKRGGVLIQRDAAGAETAVTVLPSGADEFALPIRTAALDVKNVGSATAVLARVLVPNAGTRHQLLLHTDEWKKPVVLNGISTARLNVLAASPDGRFLAVAGFADNRVEMYDAAALATGAAEPVVLDGGAPGFARVRFLAGDRLWLGSGTDTIDKGGVVFDLNKEERSARANGANAKPDDPANAAVPTLVVLNGESRARRVTVTVSGAERAMDLPPGETATAAALLPGAPALLAVAHIDDRGQSVRVTLFDPVTKTALTRLAGPTLPVRALAFSGSRPLLAAAGDDGTAFVWSVRNAARPLPTVEGLFLVERAGKVVVATAGAGPLARGDVIESVADAKGVQRAVKTPLDFVLAVRELKIGAEAQVKVTNKAAPVAVKVGTGTAFRHPLFAAWVDPVPNKAGAHDWIAWTPSGPYDANGPTAEARIGWQTSTGDPARPVELATANEYRKLYYKRDFIKLLIETCDYRAALDLVPPPADPVLTIRLDGAPLLRAPIAGATVELRDPDSVLDPERLRYEWQLTGPGTAPDWAGGRFRARAAPDLSAVRWARGAYLLRARVFADGNPNPVAEDSRPFEFVPPAPSVALLIDKVAPRGEVTTENEEVEVTAVVDAKANPDGANVVLSWTGADKPLDLTRNADGTFAPVKVKLRAGTATTIMATATNAGAGARPDLESGSAEALVRRLAPKEVPPPTVQLIVLTPFDNRLTTDAPHVVSTPTVHVQARVPATNDLAAFEWEIGDAKAVAGRLDPTTKTEVREIALPQDGKALTIRVRARYANSAFAPAAVEVRFDGLPEVSVNPPPGVVMSPELMLSGGLRVVSKRAFTVRVLVKSRASGRVREFDPTPDDALTKWDAGLTLFPGVNELGYVVYYDDGRKELRRAELVEVRYVRAPVVVGTSALDIGTGNVGPASLAVLAPADVPPSELWASGNRADARVMPRPFKLFGASVWVVRAGAVGARAGADRLEPVPVVVRNADGDSPAARVAVVGKVDAKAAPPTLRLAHTGGLVTTDQTINTGEPTFRIDWESLSDTRAGAVEVWHAGAGGRAELVACANVTEGGAPGRFVRAGHADVRLRPGAENRLRVVASNESGTTETAFLVNYTPHPVRVVIDAIKEPDGRAANLSKPEVASPFVEVEGRVVFAFADDPLAGDDNLEAVFHANGIAHPPVLVARRAGPNARERTFTGRVHLNALDPDPTKTRGETALRVELRAAGLPMALPQSARPVLTVTSTNPLRKRRLHVLVLGVEVPQAKRGELVRRVVRATGGTVPADDPQFTQGPFTRPGFDSAYLYTPSLGSTNSGHLNALLSAVQSDIRDRARRPGEDYVNDVILIYYEGADWIDERGWFLYSAATKYAPRAPNRANKAIRLDALPHVPGVPLLIANVESTTSGAHLGTDLAHLRYAWSDAAALDQLLAQYAEAIRRERTLNGVAVRVAGALDLLPTKPASFPTEAPSALGGLAFGVPDKKP